MNKTFLLALCIGYGLAESLAGQTQEISLDGAMRIAMGQAREVELAQVGVERARSELDVVLADRSPRLFAGSGLGLNSGIPQSIQGAIPSVAQLTVTQPLLDPQRPETAGHARETIRASEQSAVAAAEKSAFAAGARYIEFEMATLDSQRLLAELTHYERLEQIEEARVEEGVQVPIALSRARLETARARERHQAAESRARLAEAELAIGLALDPKVPLQPSGLDAGTAARLESAARRQPRGVQDHPEVIALSARLRAARHRVVEAKAARLPKLDIVAQYAVLARVNNYDEFFRRFQRHNVQAGVAVQIPVFTGRTVGATVAQARLRERSLALQKAARQASLALESRRSDEALRTAERREGLAVLELEHARYSLDLLLARFNEGQIALEEVVKGRVAESVAWGERMAARFNLARARLAAAYSAGRIRDVLAD